jgi:hypothetical protein
VRFLFDHDVPDDMAYTLTAMGHEVFKLRDVMDAQATDEAVLRFAGESGFSLSLATGMISSQLPQPFRTWE